MKPSPTAAIVLFALLLAAGLLSACVPATLPSQSIGAGLPILRQAPTPEPGGANQASQDSLMIENDRILLIEEIVIALLFVAVLVGIAVRQLRLPYTIGLVVIGLLLAAGIDVEITLPPNLILALLVPPLIFEAAFHLNFEDLRHNLAPILALSIPGVLATTLLVGGIVSWGTGLALPAALVFGAIVSATDPVSVVALFRTIGAPRRLQLFLEGESLLNDGTAIVVYRLFLTAAVSGAAALRLDEGLIEFVRVSGGGLLVGFLLGAVISQIIARIDDYLIETTLTTILAYGAYLAAEAMGVSGVLAVVAAGLTNGNIGPKGMSPTTRIVLANFWEYAAFLANTFIFLLIGLRVDLALLSANWHWIFWAVVAVLISRAVIVYGLAWTGRGISSKWQHILFWGGLRGAISLALALSLPVEIAFHDQLQVMTFGVVLFTLFIQGVSMAPLVRALKLVTRNPAQDEYERRHARAVANRAAYKHLENRYRQGLLSDHTWETLAPLMTEHNRILASAVRAVVISDPAVEVEELDTTRRESLRAQRTALTNLFKEGVISAHNYTQLVAEIDTALIFQEQDWLQLQAMGSNQRQSWQVNRLLAVIIQEADLESALSALNKLGLMSTNLPSQGGFLRRRNVTLLIGYTAGQEEAIVRVLQKSCRKRVEYVTTPLEAAYPAVAAPIPVQVGGATLFTFEVERFESF